MLTISIFNDWTYEREMLTNLRDHVYSKCKTRDITTVVDTALFYTHALQGPATTIFANRKFSSLKQYFAPSSFQNYYFRKDACGAYASFFCRLLTSAGYHTKIAQLNLSDRKGGHMTVCIDYKGKQYVVDPYLNHSFKGPDNKLSAINDVAKYWYSYYSLHLPEGYVPSYNYQYGWSFTNWDKFGAFSRGIYKVLCMVFDKKKVDQFSYHSYTMGFNKFYLVFSFMAFLISFYYSIRYNFGYGVRNYIRIKWNNNIARRA